MTYSDTDNLLIDVAQIWHFEKQSYADKNDNSVDDLRSYFSFFYLLKQHQPFISEQKVKADPTLQDYYDNYVKRNSFQKKWPVDFFQYGDAFYDMNVSCIISKQDVTPDIFAKVFAFKLRQFSDDDEGLSRFLSFHYFKNFQQDKTAYLSFLSSLEVHKELLSEKLIEKIRFWPTVINEHSSSNFLSKEKDEQVPSREWINSLDVGTGLDEPVLTSTDDDVEDSITENDSGNLGEEEEEEGEGGGGEEENTEEVNDANKFVIPGPIKNKGKLTREEIDHFFSFLYKDRGDGEGVYLQKEHVDKMLINRLDVPIKPLAQRASLNISSRYTKKLVNYFLYHFIQSYGARNKKRILQFIGSYIEDYADALKKDKYGNLSGNITGKIPWQDANRYNFKIRDFLPDHVVVKHKTYSQRSL